METEKDDLEVFKDRINAVVYGDSRVVRERVAHKNPDFIKPVLSFDKDFLGIWLDDK